MNTTQPAPEQSIEHGMPATSTQTAPPPQVQPARMQARDPRAKSPTIAAMLSMMPGLGQVYVGYYQRGFIHILVVASLITLLSSGFLWALEPMIGLFMAFFWLYNMIDAARRATLYNEALAGRPGIELPEDFNFKGIKGSILGGWILVIVGSLLLLNTLFGISLDWLEAWWPVAPIFIGAYLLYRAIQDRKDRDQGLPDDQQQASGSST